MISVKDGFIELYSNLILEHVPTSPEWAESISVSVLSSVLSKFAFPTRLGNLRLNLYSLAVGPSGLAHKTTPLKYFAIPTVRKVEEIARQKIFLPKSFSIEGLIEYFGKAQSKGIIISDEFTQLIKAAEGTGYLNQIMEFLSEMYDGTIQMRYTKSAKLEQVSDVYVSILSATSEYLYEVLKPSLFLQGTGNRFLFTVFDRPVMEKSPLDFFDTRHPEEINREIAEFARVLAKIHSSSLFTMKVDDAADLLLREYRDKILTEAGAKYAEKHTSDAATFDHLYLARAPEMCLKLAAIKAISDTYNVVLDEENIFNIVTVNGAAAEWAIQKSQMYVSHFYKLLEKWAKPKRDLALPVKTQEAEKRLLVHIIKSYNRVSQSKLLEESGFAKDQKYYTLVATLVDEGKIRKLSDQEVQAIPVNDRANYGIGQFKGQVPAVYEFLTE